jgi:hypothetical protein
MTYSNPSFEPSRWSPIAWAVRNEAPSCDQHSVNLRSCINTRYMADCGELSDEQMADSVPRAETRQARWIRIAPRLRLVCSGVLGVSRHAEGRVTPTGPVHAKTRQLASLLVAGPFLGRKSDRHGEDNEHQRQSSDVRWIHRGMFVVQVLVCWKVSEERRMDTHICGTAARR